MTRQVVSNTVLLTLPTPDFTMPFNVIMLTSMAMTFFYGQFFNLIFRRFHLAEPGKPAGPLSRLRSVLGGLQPRRLLDVLGRLQPRRLLGRLPGFLGKRKCD